MLVYQRATSMYNEHMGHQECAELHKKGMRFIRWMLHLSGARASMFVAVRV